MVLAPEVTTQTPARLLLSALWGRGRRGDVATGALGLCGHQIAEMLVPVVIGLTIESAITRSRPDVLFWSLALLAALFVSLTGSWRLGAIRTTRAHLHAEHELRQRVVGRVLHPGGGITAGPGATHSLATSDASNVAGVTWLVAQSSAALCAILTAGVTLVVISPGLAVAIIVAMPLALWLMYRVASPLERQTSHAQEAAADATAIAADLVSGLRVLAGLGAGATASRRYRASSRRLLDARVRAARTQSAYLAGSEVIAGLITAAVAAAAGWIALAGHIGIGSLIAVVGVVQTLQGPLTSISAVGPTLAMQRASAARVIALLQAPSPFATGTDLPAPTGRVLEVRPSGSAHRILLERGEIVGITGSPTAASRIVDTLGARHRAEPGEFLLDGACLTILQARAREAVHAPPRDPHVFSGTLAEAIVPRRRPDATGVEPGGATALDPFTMSAASLDDLVAMLPEGTDSWIAPRGANLSGGQRDRVALARALHRPEPFLVLHEPLSSVDAVTETELARNLRALRAHRRETGILLVTDSPILLGSCDRVVRL